MLANIYFFLRWVKFSKLRYEPCLPAGRQNTAQGDRPEHSNFSAEKYARFANNASFEKLDWFWFGLTLGLMFLTKYIGIILLPIYFLYLEWCSDTSHTQGKNAFPSFLFSFEVDV